MQYLVNISSICTNDLQKKKIPNFKIVIILGLLISILLYRKQEQFHNTIVCFTNSDSVKEWTIIGNNFSHF